MVFWYASPARELLAVNRQLRAETSKVYEPLLPALEHYRVILQFDGEDGTWCLGWKFWLPDPAQWRWVITERGVPSHRTQAPCNERVDIFTHDGALPVSGVGTVYIDTQCADVIWWSHSIVEASFNTIHYLAESIYARERFMKALRTLEAIHSTWNHDSLNESRMTGLYEVLYKLTEVHRRFGQVGGWRMTEVKLRV